MVDSIKDSRRKNFFIIDNIVMDSYAKVIGASALALYCYIVRRRTIGPVFPKISTISEELGMSDRTVRRSLAILSGRSDTTLADEGIDPLIAINPTYGSDGRQSSNEYELLDLAMRAVKKDRGEAAKSARLIKNKEIKEEIHSDSDSDESSSGEGDPAPTKPIDLVGALWEANGLGEKHPEEQANKGKNFRIAKVMIGEGVTPDEIAAMTKTFQKGRENMDVPPPHPMAMDYLWGKGGSVYKQWVSRGRPGLEDQDSYVPTDPEERERRVQKAREEYDRISRQQFEEMVKKARGEKE